MRGAVGFFAVFSLNRKNSKKGAGQCLSRWYNALAFGVGNSFAGKLFGPALDGFGPDARIAQLVEQRIENPRVGGSNPPPGTIHFLDNVGTWMPFGVDFRRHE